MLVARGGSTLLTARENASTTPPECLKMAAGDHHISVLRELLRAAGNRRSAWATMLVQTVVATGNTAAMRVLLECGASMRFASEEGAITNAVASHNPQILRLLLEAKGDPNYPMPGVGKAYVIPATLPAMSNREDMLGLLLAAKASVRQVHSSSTLLVAAQKHSTYTLVKLLLQHGASALETDSNLNTPVHYACTPPYNPKALKVLLDSLSPADRARAASKLGQHRRSPIELVAGQTNAAARTCYRHLVEGEHISHAPPVAAEVEAEAKQVDSTKDDATRADRRKRRVAKQARREQEARTPDPETCSTPGMQLPGFEQTRGSTTKTLQHDGCRVGSAVRAVGAGQPP